ncbi:MAG: hypothetical protein JST26_04780 [Bacteroidetes bacterium]|nr:hypothetical protein [Bacteroidota bacterium]
MSRMFFRNNIIDSSRITCKMYKHITYVNAKGVLCFQTKNIQGEVIGVSEWPNEVKKRFGVNVEVIVLDIIIEKIEYPE